MPVPKKKEVGNDALLEAAGAEIPDPVVLEEKSSLRTPEITTAQYVALVPVLANLLHAFGVFSLSQEEQDALTEALNYSLALLGADAVIRVGRSVGIGRK